MGGEGSGRHQDPVKQHTERLTAIGNAGNSPIFIPNYSGIREEVRKDNPIGFLKNNCFKK